MNTPPPFNYGLIGFGLFCSISSLSVQAQTPQPLSEEAYWGEVPVVMSATRIAQPVTDAPVAVTVIDRRMIDASGAREIPELFRMVPGFIVGYHDGHTPSVSYHMSDERYSRRLQVLVDGRSIYTTAIGAVPWATLHITMDDIERIEVVRGPNSASYGANSFLAVINIITREAVLDHGTSVKTNLGDDGVRELFVRHGGGVGKLDYRVSAGFIGDDGFDNRLDYKRTQLASLRADYQLSSSDVISFQGGVATGPRGVENRFIPDLSVDREKELLNHHEHIKWQRTLGLNESLSVQFYHIYQRNFETFYNGAYSIAGVTLAPNYLDFSRRTDRYDLELQHNINLAETVRVAWGGGVRDDQVWGGENLMGDEEIHNHLKHGFINLEWAPEGDWLLNAGAMVEDYSTTGTEVSPRLGVNYRFSPGQSLRLTGSKAIRAPSMFEYATDYGIYNAQLDPSGTMNLLFWKGTQQTEVEKVTSYEFGYHLAPIQGNMSLDVKLFHDELTDLIFKVGTGNCITSHCDTFLNSYAFTIQGAELEAKFTFVDSSALYFAYSYVDIKDNSNPPYGSDPLMAPEHSFSLLYMMDFNHEVTAGVGFYFTDWIQGWEADEPEAMRAPVRRLDLKLARQLDLFGYETELALAARNVLGKYEEMEVLSHDPSFPNLNEVDSSAYVTVRIQLDR